MPDKREVVRVAVIGVGSAGLSQLDQLVQAFERDDVRGKKRLHLVGYESRASVGGIWNHDPTPEKFVTVHQRTAGGQEKTHIFPKKGENPTAVYDGLQATLPSDLMKFRDCDFPEDTHVFPYALQICRYLQDYASAKDLNRYIRFSTPVERLYQKPDSPSDGGSWVVETSAKTGERVVEEFDFVSICNGHYSEPWIPHMPGLSTFPGQVLHSREYRRASDYAGKNVLVIGSFSSGSDITRLLAGNNVGHYTPSGEPLDPASPPPQGYTGVWQSTTGIPNKSAIPQASQKWLPYIQQRPVIDHFDTPSPAHPKGVIHFKEHPTTVSAALDHIDVIIYATGYHNTLPFCKKADAPWNGVDVLDEVIGEEKRDGGEEWEIGGLRGLHMTGLDQLLLFLENDRSIAFPGLPYSIVPFPFAEAQARLCAFLWAGLLPSFPEHPTPPVNVYNPFYSPPLTPPPETTDPDTQTDANLEVTPDISANVKVEPQSQPTDKHSSSRDRLSIRQRRELIFPAPYEFEYTEYVFDLLKEAQDGRQDVPDYYRRVSQEMKDRRADVELRLRHLGY